MISACLLGTLLLVSRCFKKKNSHDCIAKLLEKWPGYLPFNFTPLNRMAAFVIKSSLLWSFTAVFQGQFLLWKRGLLLTIWNTKYSETVLSFRDVKKHLGRPSCSTLSKPTKTIKYLQVYCVCVCVWIKLLLRSEKKLNRIRERCLCILIKCRSCEHVYSKMTTKYIKDMLESDN